MNKRNVNLYWDKWNFGPEERAGIHPSTSSKYIDWVNDPSDVAFPTDVICPVKLAFVVTVAAFPVISLSVKANTFHTWVVNAVEFENFL